MKNTQKIAAKAAKAVAERALRREANATTCFALYQPKAPANLSRFKVRQK